MTISKAQYLNQLFTQNDLRTVWDNSTAQAVELFVGMHCWKPFQGNDYDNDVYVIILQMHIGEYVAHNGTLVQHKCIGWSPLDGGVVTYPTVCEALLDMETMQMKRLVF